MMGRQVGDQSQTHTFERLQHLRLDAAPSVGQLASDAYDATWR